MYAWQIFYQRNRRLLFRYGAAAVIGIGALIALMPRLGAREADVASTEAGLMVTPAPMASAQFVHQYDLVYRAGL